MGIFCYVSEVLPGKLDEVRAHWKGKRKSSEELDLHFWDSLGMTGFESWLQGSTLIHCLQARRVEEVFVGLRKEIEAKQPIALQLQRFYLDVLGKDYASPSSEPQIETLFDKTWGEKEELLVKSAFSFPVPLELEQELFNLESLVEGFDGMLDRCAGSLHRRGDETFLVVYAEHEASVSLEDLTEPLGALISLPEIPSTEWLTEPTQLV